MSPPLEFRFVTSADTVDRLPDTRAEVAFVGRSNVGKSSLLNALANRKRLAHTSKTPGRTQLLNCFALGDGTTAVDCPGYGFAAVPGRTRSGWQEMIEGYLTDREGLAMILVLVDGEVGPTKLDVQMLEWLTYQDLPHVVVATKHDKVKPSKRGARERDVAERTGRDDVVWVSAAKNVGIDRLRDQVRRWLGEATTAPSSGDRSPAARLRQAPHAPGTGSSPGEAVGTDADQQDEDSDDDWGPVTRI
jgi:GTP-binding protein